MIDEAARREYEADWKRGAPRPLRSYLPSPGDPRRLPTLEELVHIELELSWRARARGAAAPPPRAVLDYLRDHPELASAEIAVRLLEAEAAVRGRYASGPSPAVEDRVGRYVVIAEHARGGMGRIFRAEDPALRRVVALKRLEPGPDEAAVRARFLTEARITAGLDHPGVVPVHELGERDGEPYIAMRLVAGRTLAEVIEAGDMPLTARLDVFRAVARTVAFAHSRRVVHRDLKPGNIIVGEYGETIILDWGIARELGATEPEPEPEAGGGASGPGVTRAGDMLGTPAYMSPEQADGRVEAVDERSDVFALGAVLYHLVCGRRPFEGEDTQAVLAAVRRAAPPTPRAVTSEVPRALSAICMKALRLRPQDRYQTAAALVADLDALLAGLPVSAHRESMLERLWRFVRMHRTGVATTAVAVVLLTAAGIGGAFWWQHTLEQSRAAAARRVADQEVALAAELAGAEAALRGGHFAAAEAGFANALVIVRSVSELASRAASLDVKRRRVLRLARFYGTLDRAWFAAGHDPEGPGARRLARQALASLEVSDEQITQLAQVFAEELTPEQAGRLHEDTGRLLLLSGILHATSALLDPLGAAATASCTRSLVELTRAERFGPSVVSNLLRAFCELRTGKGLKLETVDARNPTHPIDHYFLGFIHLWLHDFPASVVSVMGRMLSSRAKGMSFEEPLPAAIEHFRIAAAREPERYWNHFMSAWALTVSGDFEGAELALNTCIALRPDYHHGYLARGSAILRSALDERPPNKRLLPMAMADLERAKALAPEESLVFLEWAGAYLRMGRSADAMRSLRGALTRTEALHEVLFVRQKGEEARAAPEWAATWLPAVRKYAKAGDVNARASAAAMDLIGGRAEQARKALQGSSAAGDLAIRGLACLHLGELPAAEADLSAALAGAPGTYAAQAGLARVYERTERRAEAERAFRAALALARSDWQRVAAEAGIARIATRERPR